MNKTIEIVGANKNNLKSIDVTLPSKATMVIGVSGSGKSSLLSNTIATEANSRMQRYLNFQQPHLGNEDVDAFIGKLPTCVHFTQSAFRASSRTTIGTSTGILSLLRRLFFKHATPWSEEIKAKVPKPSVDSYAGWLTSHYKGALTVWVVTDRWQRTDGVRSVNELKKNDINFAVFRSEFDTSNKSNNDRLVDLTNFKPLSVGPLRLIEAKIGRINLPDDISELKKILQISFGIRGDVIVELEHQIGLPSHFINERGALIDSAFHWVHPDVFLPYLVPSNALLSFNSPSSHNSGACPVCHGLGVSLNVDIEELVINPNKSMHGGCFSLWTEKNYKYINIQHKTIEGMRGLKGFCPDTSWNHLSRRAKELILYGSGDDVFYDVDPQSKRRHGKERGFNGFIELIKRRHSMPSTPAKLKKLVKEVQCNACMGTRWSREARALLLGQWGIHDILKLTFNELVDLTKVNGPMDKSIGEIAPELVNSLFHTATAFVEAGLGHLSGERGMSTLSEGESRRSRLATILKSGGEGLALLLDEPARGLHEEDINHLSNALLKLKRKHTLIFNDHKVSLARVADQVLEIGPGAGCDGGQVVFQGSSNHLSKITSQIEISRKQLPVRPLDDWLTISGACVHTISDITFKLPLEKLVTITGVSGSGKSSLINGIVIPALSKSLSNIFVDEEHNNNQGTWDGVYGFQKISNVLVLNPRPASRQRRSTLVTFLKLANQLRKIFADLPDAKCSGLRLADFGLNAGNGRCITCHGLGERKENGTWITCSFCGGSGYGKKIMDIKFDGQSITEILELPISELVHQPISINAGWTKLLQQIIALELGYLTLGHRVDQLSGGEHQRIRIAQTLAKKNANGLLLVLDEPSAGLHPNDVKRLLKSIDHVVSEGKNTVLLIEHNIDLIRTSDWIIDMGPGGGPKGGKIVGEGTPQEISKLNTPTGLALAGKISKTTTPLNYNNKLNSKNKINDPVKLTKDATRWLRRLVGEDVAPTEMDNFDFNKLSVPYTHKVDDIRALEIAYLDIEIGRFILDRTDNTPNEILKLANLWLKHPEARIQINPYMEEIVVWGDKIPNSNKKLTKKRLSQFNLEFYSELLNSNLVNRLRVSGKRFEPISGQLDERIRLVRDALDLGGGFVELAIDKSHILGQICTRFSDLDSITPTVAPAFMNSADLSRKNGTGGCPCCKGVGIVQTIPERFFINNSDTNPTDDYFLTSECHEILKGIRRNNLIPFFKKMVTEGLWQENKIYSQLDPKEKAILLYGFWCRPGHGSFLKTTLSNREEVRSWLRWDGLIPLINMELDRSKNLNWQNQVKESQQQIICPNCSGTGLRQYLRAVRFGQQSFFELVLKGTVEEFVQEMKKIDPQKTRKLKMKERILYCLEPLEVNLPKVKLNQPISDVNQINQVYKRVVKSMTRLNLVG